MCVCYNYSNIHIFQNLTVLNMVDSDHSEVEEENMDKLELSTDSMKVTTNKRLHIDSDQEEQVEPAKKRRLFSSKESETLEKKSTEFISDKNGIDKNNVKEEKTTISENGSELNEKSLSDSNIKKTNEEEQENIKTKNEKESPVKDENNATADESPAKIKEDETENEVTI